MKSVALTRRTAMYQAQRALGARFAEHGGWLVADGYTSAAEEARQARAAVGLVDASAGGKIGVRGAAVDQVLGHLGGKEPLAPGRVARLPLDGAETLVGRVAPDELLLLTSGGDAADVCRRLAVAGAQAGCAHVTDLTAALGAVELLGPAASRLLARLAPLDLSPRGLPPLALVAGEVARVRAIVVRLDPSPLPTFLLLIPREYGESVWQAFVDAGRDLGLTPVGRAARALLRDG
jgi:heterotetrameric sarcosine oxidase gamma subunit